MNADVRDILEIDTNANKEPSFRERKRLKRAIEPIKRPTGINREVWGLIRKDDMEQPPIIPTEEPQIYKHPKAKFRNKVRKWRWIPFKNSARSDNAEFCHWRCATDDAVEYPFARLNKKVNLQTYTEAEYIQYLEDENWTKAETDYLFELCQQYDLRFYIIHDRWDSAKFNKDRSLDEIKDRYYKVVGILDRLRSGDENKEIFVFDADHEKRRREQLQRLLNRTKDQIDEEIYLLEELKKIEIRKRERERKSHEVSKLLTATDFDRSQSSESPVSQRPVGSLQPISTSSSATKRTKQRKSSVNPNDSNQSISPTGSVTYGSTGDLSKDAQKGTKKSLIFKAVVESAGIKFPDTKTAGVSLRSYKMKLPQSLGSKKTKAIEQSLEKLQIEARPIATEKICEQFNELRSEIVLLYELKQALSNTEFEYQTLCHRYMPSARNLETSTLDTSSASTSSQTLVNTPQKKISEIFDVSITPTSSLVRVEI